MQTKETRRERIERLIANLNEWLDGSPDGFPHRGSLTNESPDDEEAFESLVRSVRKRDL